MDETNAGKMKEWLKADDEKRKKIEFVGKLKYGKHPMGTTMLNPGQELKVVNGRIEVR